jgi:hypothetical protein
LPTSAIHVRVKVVGHAHPTKDLPGQDSNLDKENQNLLCYRYTTGY